MGKRGQLLHLDKAELFRRAQTASKVCLISVLILMLVFLVQAILSVESASVSFTLLGIQLLPFLFVGWGLWRRHWPAYAWMLFFINLYFVAIVLRLFENPTDLLNGLLLIVLAAIFVSALLFVRWSRVAEVRP